MRRASLFVFLALPALVAGLSFSLNAQVLSIRARDAGSKVPGSLVVRTLPGTLPRGGGPLAGPVLMKGWPKTIQAASYFAPQRGLLFADLDQDGRMEVIRSSTNGMVYVWRSDGSAFPGWPKATIGSGQIVPTAADLDGDGTLEILVPTRGLTKGGMLYVFRANGSNFPGWPKSLSGNNVSGGVVAADLDGDGKLEVIAQERAWPVGYVHVFRYDGSRFPGSWPFKLDHVPTGTPAVGDVDGDGKPEIVCLSYNSLFVLDASGKVKPGFPYNLSKKNNARFSYQSPALGDLTGDGKLEIAVCAHWTGSGCYVFRWNGTLLPGWPNTFGGKWSYCPPTLADIDGDGRLDVLAGRRIDGATGYVLYAWKAAGGLLPGFPTVNRGSAESPITVADIDGDGVMEIFHGSNLMDSATGKGWLHCVDAKGKVEPGFPLRVPGFTYMNGATLGDVDGDGVLEMGVVSYNKSNVTVALYKLPGPRIPGRILWKTYHEGNARRGRQGESDRFSLVGKAAPGGTLRMEFHGKPADRVFALLGLGVGVTPLGSLGVLRLDPKRPVFLFKNFLVGSSGRVYSTFSIPNNPALSGGFLAFQGLDVRPATGGARLLQMVPLRIR